MNLLNQRGKFCWNIAKPYPHTNFLVENSAFGRGSIRNLLVHIGNTYEFWIGTHALHKTINFTPYNAVTNALAAKEYFLTIDALTEQFMQVYSREPNKEIEININEKIFLASPLKLFTHVITHEFHHKGQILSLSRHLGYVPVDTDIIR
ncbi:DinB family protein [Adhaeribacter rhizoryzae]|uniref:Damage-inducible protein DinB n=1 Tax=Adhaeribacter rhizoryzae TaxID=2607907 RepID=A0A5M6D8U0_9BACT|nr:DinB family protein [Adhaeribacter rhizoryzae]KAA5543958.1 damage-inducible protein DinB [Adhaeribacter rhizoryzae]